MKSKIKKTIINIVATVIGAFIMAIGVANFLLPNQLSSGGVSGIATITYYLLKIPMGVTIITVNMPIYLFARYKLGKELFINSIIGTISLSVFIDFLDKFESFSDIALSILTLASLSSTI